MGTRRPGGKAARRQRPQAGWAAGAAGRSDPPPVAMATGGPQDPYSLPLPRTMTSIWRLKKPMSAMMRLAANCDSAKL